jgi:hypothetical protein
MLTPGNSRPQRSSALSPREKKLGWSRQTAVITAACIPAARCSPRHRRSKHGLACRGFDRQGQNCGSQVLEKLNEIFWFKS